MMQWNIAGRKQCLLASNIESAELKMETNIWYLSLFVLPVISDRDERGQARVTGV